MPVLDKELNNIKIKVAAMSQIAIGMYQDAISALSTHNIDLAQEVVKRDVEVDLLELEIDELCLNYLALQSPKALALRYTVSVLRLIIDLERVADHCKVIARQVFNHHCAALLKALPDFEALSFLSLRMLEDSFTSFFELDDKMYESIIATDQEVGRLQKELNRHIIELIKRDTSSVDGAVALINVVRRLERVGDHAKNIAELTPYIAKGSVVRHKDKKINADINN